MCVRWLLDLNHVNREGLDHPVKEMFKGHHKPQLEISCSASNEITPPHQSEPTEDVTLLQQPDLWINASETDPLWNVYTNLGPI